MTLDEIAKKHGTDKATMKPDGTPGHGYTDVYEGLLVPLFYDEEDLGDSAELLPRAEPVRLLEIGVGAGASLRTWAEWFDHWRQVMVDDGYDREVLPLRTELYCIDIEDKAAESEAVGAWFWQGDAEDPGFLAGVFPGVEWDVVIDDGSHRTAGWRACVESLLPRVRPGGVLVIEDIHAWLDHWEGTGDAWLFFGDLLAQTVRPVAFAGSPMGSDVTRWWRRLVESVEFRGGLCIIRRKEG